ncbi:MAG: hypothetical protein ACXVEE_38115 [Polyangiales bacterium]
MDVSSTKPRPLTDTTPPLTSEEPKKAAEKKKPAEYQPPPAPSPSEKKGILGFYAAATAPLPNGSGGSPLLPKAPPPPLPKNGNTGNPLMDAVVPPPAAGAPQLMIAAKKSFPHPNDTVGPAAASGAVKDPEVAAEVAESQAEANAEAECRAVVGMPFDDLHVPRLLKPAKRIAEDETADALCKPVKKEKVGPLSNVPQTKNSKNEAPTGRPNENDLAPKPPAYVPIAPSQGTAATSVKQKPSSSAGACPVPPKASTPANATTSNADGTES